MLLLLPSRKRADRLLLLSLAHPVSSDEQLARNHACRALGHAPISHPFHHLCSASPIFLFYWWWLALTSCSPKTLISAGCAFFLRVRALVLSHPFFFFFFLF